MGENICKLYVWQWSSIQDIDREFLQLTNKKTTTQDKNEEEIWIAISPKKIHAVKDAQHHYTPLKCKKINKIKTRQKIWIDIYSKKLNKHVKRCSKSLVIKEMQIKNVMRYYFILTAAAAKSLQSCPTLCDPIDGSPPGSPVPGILQARTLEWVAIPFSNAWKWKVKVKLLSCVQLLTTPWTAAYQAPLSLGFSRQEYWSGVPLPSPHTHCCSVASVVSDSVQPHRQQPTRLPHPWGSPGKNTGVGCHFLPQCRKMKVKSLSRVRLLVTPWTAACQAPLSMGFSRQEYWSGVPLPSPILTSMALIKRKKKKRWSLISVHNWKYKLSGHVLL